MNPGQLLAHFDRISDAPDAIPRLRRFILDLAVRGKLVEQDPRDEPASELLKRVQNSTAQLINKKQTAEVDGAEFPLELPTGWELVPLIALGKWAIGSGFPKNEQGSQSGPFFFLKVSDMNLPGNERCITTSQNFIDQQAAIRMGARIHPAGTIIFPKIGGAIATNKRRILTRESAIDNNCLGIIFWPELSLDWCYLVLTSLDFTKYQAGTAVPALQQGGLEQIPIGLPPLAEQHRIVAKVDELMALCDRLEAAQTQRESRRDRLAASSLHRLNNGADADAFHDHARFYFNHLLRLTTKPKHIQQLRQTILNLAVRGKLVTKDLNNRPVRVIDRKEISLSKDYDGQVFNESLSALNLPSSWGVEPLIKVVAAIVDCPHSTPKWADKGRICVRTNQFRPGHLDLSESRYVSEETYVDRIQRLEPSHNDILYSREGGILGVACRIPPRVKLCLGQRMMLIRAGEATTAQFLEMVLNSPFITTIARTRTTGGAAPRVNVATIKAYPIPLPPLAEQARIVAKVDELMALCDKLETQLTIAHTDTRRLLEAVLQEALTPTLNEPYDRESANPFS